MSDTYRNLINALRIQTEQANTYRRLIAVQRELAQLYAQGVLEYLLDLVTASPNETFTKDEVLILLNAVKNDTDMFPPEIIIEFQEIERYLERKRRSERHSAGRQ